MNEYSETLNLAPTQCCDLPGYYLRSHPLSLNKLRNAKTALMNGVVLKSITMTQTKNWWMPITFYCHLFLDSLGQ